RRQTTFSREYDDLGHVRKINYPEGVSYEMVWSDRHTLLAAKGPSGLTWKYVYDENRLLLESENPLGHKHSYQYDDYGQVVSATTPTGGIFRYAYDNRGYMAVFVDARGARTARELDDHGNVLRLMDANGVITQFTYDGFDRLIQVVDGDQKVWRFAYDTQGRLAREYFPAGHYVEHFYNTCGLEVAIRRADGVISRCDWDTEPGRIQAIHDGNGNTLRYGYDVLGRPIERINWDGSVMKMEYDPDGNIVAIVDPNGDRQEFEYDAFDQMIERRSGEEVAKFEYDVNGFMTAAIGKSHEVRWERDLYGRSTAEIQDGQRIEYTFDAIGRRTSMRTALGDDVEYEWEPTVLLGQARFGDASVSFRRDGRGRELSRLFGGGAKFERRWDVMGRLVQEWFTPPPGGPAAPLSRETLGRLPVAFDRSYTYDANGHLELVRDALRGSSELFHDLVGQLRGVTRFWGQAEFFDFDSAYNRVGAARLSSASPPRPQQVFAPGAGPNSMDYGGLTAAGAELERNVIGPGNRLHTVQKSAETITYEFDRAGFVTEKRVSRRLGHLEIWKFQWDIDGRLIQLQRPDGAVWSYEYDALGRRLKKVGPNRSTRYLWDGSRVLHVLEDGEDPTTYVYDPTNYNLLMRKRGDQTTYALPDQSTATSEFVRADGVVAWWRLSEVWGKALAPRSADLGFNGQWLDDESGLFYNHFRYYDPDIGRYLSPDPIGVLGGLNEYAFVPCPFEAFDPDGLAKALGGGPMEYTGGYDRENRPTLRRTRTVRDGNGDPPYNDRRVPSPGNGSHGPDAGGKCLAVTRGPEGQTNAFVSGQGRPGVASSPDLPASWGVTPGQMGNWTHAEIQALNHIRQTGQPGQTYDLFIDRPCCPRCDTSVPRALTDLSAAGVTVRVHYMETDDSGKTRWTTLPDASHGGCG
ncbi:MAG TPA: RHS repeat-associated core domain-containing protein, partial [Polyangiaceae bacterium]